MRKRKTSSVILCILALLLCFGGTVLYTWTFIMVDDTKPPVISMEPGALEASVHASTAELLAGVTAVDDRDGDVTAGILVEGVSDLIDDTVIVTYAAFDEAGNVAKASRPLRYTDYASPRFELEGPLVFQSGVAMDVLGQFAVTDVIDGDIRNRIKASLAGDASTLSMPGLHPVEFRVTNSLGDTSYLTLPVEVLNMGQYNASVVLDDYLVYVPQGVRFNAEGYVKGLDIGRGNAPISDMSRLNVQIEDQVNVNVPGVYSVCYTVSCTQSMVNYVGYTRLNVVVEER